MVIAAACLAQASASSLPAIPWWPGIQSSEVFPARLLSMRLRSVVSVEPIWVDTGGVSDDPIFQLFTTCVVRLVGVPQRGVGIVVTA